MDGGHSTRDDLVDSPPCCAETVIGCGRTKRRPKAKGTGYERGIGQALSRAAGPEVRERTSLSGRVSRGMCGWSLHDVCPSIPALMKSRRSQVQGVPRHQPAEYV